MHQQILTKKNTIIFDIGANAGQSSFSVPSIFENIQLFNVFEPQKMKLIY